MSQPDTIVASGVPVGPALAPEALPLDVPLGPPCPDAEGEGAGVLAAYADAPWRERLHVLGRWRSCPFEALAGFVPASGRILDMGCGHGLLSLYLAMGSPYRGVTGLDIDAGKIAVAKAAARRSGATNVGFVAIEPGARPTGQWDAITIVDILYLLGHDTALAMVRAAAAALAPGGVLLVKEMDDAPRWKRRVTRAQELVATRVVRITEGDEVDLVPPAAIAGAMEQAGLAVACHPLHRGKLHPHHLVLGRRHTL
jgi:2-polyprenyl-3-methyl-5-hydroxy-6-metoxy-1,4-benzoquinol methylase